MIKEKQLSAIGELMDNVDRYLPEVSRKVKNPAIALSIAKYYPALLKLAEE